MPVGNTVTRIIVSIIAIPAILLVSYLGSYYFISFCLLIGSISYYELWVFVKDKNINVNLLLGISSIVLVITNVFNHFIDFYFLTILIIVAVTLIELFRNNGSPIINTGTTLLGIFYIGLFSSALVYLRELYPTDYEKGGFIIISV
ncbi:MAG: phosphatidate cytidylyltransferase [Ignavibacteriaceae bacterium]